MHWLEQTAAPGKKKSRKQSRKPDTAHDAMAAAIILRDYLNHERQIL